MKIQTVSKFLVVALVGLNLIILSMGYLWLERYRQFESQWHQYSEIVSRKSALMNLVKDALGYGGMADHLKNYVLKGQKADLILAHRDLHLLKTAILIYRQLPTSELELTSIDTIEKAKAEYFDAALAVEKLRLENASMVTQAYAIAVDDNKVLEAIHALEDYILSAKERNMLQITSGVDSMGRNFIFVGFVIVIMVLLLAGYFYHFVGKQVVNPIRQLLSSFKQIDLSKNSSERLPREGAKRCSELDELAQAGNQFLDIAERQMHSLFLAHAKAREKQAHISAILDSTAEGILTIDTRGTILSFNQKCEEIFGYESQELLGKNVNCLMRPEERAVHDKYLREADLTEKRVINANRELWGRRKNQQLFPMELTVSATQSKEGTCYIGVIQDISERKAAERKLLNAKVEAEKASRAKSRFLSAMSHELRTPLNAILGFSQLMLFNRKEQLSEVQKKNTEQILQAGQHLLTLINDILDLSKIETGNFEIEFEWVELPSLLEESVEMLQSQALGAEVTLHFESRLEEDYCLYTSYTRLKQVMINLISNAIKYNHAGGDVWVRDELLDDKRVCIAIEDNGVGIDKSNFEDVFKAFIRFDERANQIEGTGIGLSVCQSLVSAMNGEIRFDSEKGKGTTFYIDLPVVDDDMADLNSPFG